MISCLALLFFISLVTSGLQVSLAKWDTLERDGGWGEIGEGEPGTSLLFASWRICGSFHELLWLLTPHSPHWFQLLKGSPSFWALVPTPSPCAPPALGLTVAFYYCGSCIASLLSFSAGPSTVPTVTCIKFVLLKGLGHSWLYPDWDTILYSLDWHRFKCRTILRADKDAEQEDLPYTAAGSRSW